LRAHDAAAYAALEVAMPRTATTVVPAALVGALGAAVGVTGAWLFDERVFKLPGILAGFVIPTAICSVAYVATLLALARRGRDGAGIAALVLGIWAVLCPLLVGGAAWASHVASYSSDPDAAQLPFGQLAGIGSHKALQAAVRALLGVAGAGWLLVRALLRRRPAAPAERR
jgi:hypothetical protein